MTKKKQLPTRQEIKAIIIVMIRWLELDEMIEIAEAMRKEGIKRGEPEFWME